jgi:hypothetical protein
MPKSRKNRAAKEPNQVRFAISDISLVREELKPPSEQVPVNSNRYSYSLKADTNILAEKSIVQIIINYRFKLDGDIIFEIEVLNNFRFDNFKEIIIDGKVKDENLSDFLVDLSTTHTRGMQAMIIKGSSIDHLYLPPIDPKKVRKKNEITSA